MNIVAVSRRLVASRSSSRCRGSEFWPRRRRRRPRLRPTCTGAVTRSTCRRSRSAKAKPGTIIRSTPIADVPAGARAWKILYHSRAVDGKDIAVSGVVVAPDRQSAARRASRGDVGGRRRSGSPTGARTRSSPTSRPVRPARASATHATLIPMLQTFLDAGYVVAATDYEGLGTPGSHPIARRREHGARRARRGSRGTRREGCRRREQGARLRAVGRWPRARCSPVSSRLRTRRICTCSVSPPWRQRPRSNSRCRSSRPAASGNGFVVTDRRGLPRRVSSVRPRGTPDADALAKASVVDQKCDICPAFANDTMSALAHSPLDTPALATILRTNAAGNRPAGAPLLVNTVPVSDTATAHGVVDAHRRQRTGS